MRGQQAVIDEALKIMRGWLKLMVAEVAAEFPEWEFVLRQLHRCTEKVLLCGGTCVASRMR